MYAKRPINQTEFKQLKSRDFCHQGYRHFQESGLYYLQSRYYNPEIGRFLNADDIAYLGVDGTILSNNLFAYCKNNPISNIDSTGYGPLKNILHWGIENIAQPVTGWLEEQAEESPNIVSSSGYSWSAAFGASGAHSIGITRDTKGNIGIIFTDAVGGGFPTASFSSYYNVTFASDIYSQRGVSTILGGSINTPIVGVGGEGSFFTDPNTGAFCGGVSVMAGVGTSFPVEIHGEVAYSRVYGFNIFDIAHNVYDWILGW